MTDTPRTPDRRDFLARALAALSGVWLGRGLTAPKAAALPTESPYVGEIRMFAGNFAPSNWMFCEGQLLSIADNDALFNLIGTTYGGDGQTTFALPDLRGRAPVHAGTTHQLGQWDGTEAVTLIASQMPAHAHSAAASSALGDNSNPSGRVPARNTLGAPHYDGGINTALAAGALQSTGGSQPHANMQPYLAINFIISLYGVFPSQS